MNRFRRNSVWLCWIGFLMAATVGIKAAPMLAPRKKLPDEVLSLADIRKVSIHINVLPRALRANGVEREQLEEIIRGRLKGARIEISEEPFTPHLVLTCIATTDPAVPDGAAVVCFLDVHQEVKLVRLNRQMNLPVATMLEVAQSTRTRVAEVVRQQCFKVTDAFIGFARRATAGAN